MPAIIIPRRHLIQPQGVVLPSQSPLANGLLLLQSGSDFALGGGAPTGSPPIESTPVGSGFRGGAGKYYSALADYAPAPGNGFSVAFSLLCKSTVKTGLGAFSIAGSSVSTGPRLLIACSATNLFRVYIGGTYKINVAGNLAAGNQVLCIFTHDGTNSALYVNGERRGESTGAFGTENANSWYLGSGYNGQVDAVYGLHAQWSRALSESECADLSANPWQLFRANPVRFYSLPSGPITLNSLTASNITSSGARFTVGLTR